MKIYNSLTLKKEEFKPFEDKKVGIYVCGITPYDTTHLGHAFTYMFFDVLARYLRFKDYKVTYAQNVTDIDDDILKKAKEVNKNWIELGNFWTMRFLTDIKSLNINFPDIYCKATDSIDVIINITKTLIEKGFAYQKGGNVYFGIGKFKNYGRLSRMDKKEMIIISKERGGDPSDPLKKNPLDFLLWQSTDRRTKQNEPFWESPWSKGRPGWHIECSAMISKFLGEQVEIHGGGKDLIFPHHESEIAQSESFTGKKPFVKYWMHTAMVLYEREKMAKSLGNLVMVSDLLKKATPNEIRYLLLMHQYRTPWEYMPRKLLIAKNSFKTIKVALGKIKISNKPPKDLPKNAYFSRFIKFMDDDINTPAALNLLLKMSKGKSPDPEILSICLSILGFKN